MTAPLKTSLIPASETQSRRHLGKIVHVPGIKHRAADGISCYPIGEPIKLTLPDYTACIKRQCPDSAPSLQSLAFLTIEFIFV